MISRLEQPRLASAEEIASLITSYVEESHESDVGNKRKRNDDEPSALRANLIHTFFHHYIKEKINSSDYKTFIFSKKEFDAYHLTRHLTFPQKQALNRSVASVTAAEVNDFILQLQTKGGIVKVAADIDRYQNHPHHAFLGFMNGHVTIEQFTSTCLLYQAIDQFIVNRRVCLHYSHDVHILPIPPSRHVPKLQTYSIFQNSEYVKNHLGLNDQGINKLIECLKSKPDSEQYYHTIEMPEGPMLQSSMGHQRIIDALGILNSVEVGDSDKFKGVKQCVMVIPSYSMFLERIKMVYQNRAISFVPCVGMPTKKLITLFKLQDLRLFQVGMPSAPVPLNADGQFFGSYSFTMHDYYHGESDCWMTPSVRRAVCFIHEFIFSKSINAKTKDIKWALMDGELLGRKGHFGHLFTVKKCSWDLAHIHEILTLMAKLPDFWKHEFFITADHLLPEQREIYDKILPTVTTEEREKAERDLFNFYKITTRLHDSFAQFRLGCMYYEGKGTPLSNENAFRHWQLSGSPPALCGLGRMYDHGHGVKKDLHQAFAYYLRAADAGYAESQFDIGNLYFFANERDFDWVKRDIVKALEYYTLASEQGHVASLRKLGNMYKDGVGVTCDLEKFVQFFQRAAGLGDSSCQLELGEWYFNVKEEFSVAFKYYSLAAEQGNAEALFKLGVMYAEGKGVEVDYQKSFSYFQRAASAGLGVSKDLAEAERYFILAAKQGNSQAKENLKILQSEKS